MDLDINICEKNETFSSLYKILPFLFVIVLAKMFAAFLQTCGDFCAFVCRKLLEFSFKLLSVKTQMLLLSMLSGIMLDTHESKRLKLWLNAYCDDIT